MEEPSESKFIRRYYDSSTGIAYFTWKTGSEDMQDDDYKQVLRNSIAFVKRTGAKRQLIDARDLRFTVNIQLQAWIVEEIIPLYISTEVERFAYVIPEEFIAKLSVEQMKDEIDDSAKEEFQENAVFANWEDAIAWLNASDE